MVMAVPSASQSSCRCLCRLAAAAVALTGSSAASLTADQVDLAGPAGSGSFGTSITLLPNGNFVVTDPEYDGPDGRIDIGAVYLYSPNARLISVITGAEAYDNAGSGGIVVVGGGNFLICSPEWCQEAGAVTWANGATGVSGTISQVNSLTGANPGEQLGAKSNPAITVLVNGNYVVCSPGWGGGTSAKGAVIWGNGASGITGAVSTSNALTGSSTKDNVGKYGITPLTNGNYVVPCPDWNNGLIADAGAVVWGSGTTGITGSISQANALVGSSAGDDVGSSEAGRPAVTPLKNGNYVVMSPYWTRGSIGNAGAVTWGNGATGVKGPVSETNSIVGSAANDFRDWETITELANGNYVFCAPAWNSGNLVDAGAARWCSGTAASTGPITAANALVGDQSNELVGYDRVVPLSNGNYVVPSLYWHNGSAINAGAVTWGHGATGVKGTITSSNSLVGTEARTNIGSGGVTALSNGNYVVCSPYVTIDNRAQAGAATWCSGVTGRAGQIVRSNSLVGAKAGDQIGLNGAFPLINGNYVVVSSYASSGTESAVGAVTWCRGNTGRLNEMVTVANSLMGSQTGDRIGASGLTQLSNGHFLIRSVYWSNGSQAAAGAVTWGDGTKGLSGIVSSTNSLIGGTANDRLGSEPPVALPNGNFVVVSPLWNNGAASAAGAVSWGNGEGGSSGLVSAVNSLVGSTTNDQIGSGGVSAFSDGSYLVCSPLWDRGGYSNAGALTRGMTPAGVAGPVSALNSLVGSGGDDQLGKGTVKICSDGAGVVSAPQWSNGTVINAGAVACFPAAGPMAGPFSQGMGIMGTERYGGAKLSFEYDPARARMIVGQPAAQKVSLFSYATIFTPQEKFGIWAAEGGLQGPDATLEAAPFGDDISNLLKYAFRLNPAGPDRRTLEEESSAGLPRFERIPVEDGSGSAVFRVEYLRMKNSGLAYQPKVSSDLSDFVPMDGTESVSEIDSTWERVVLEQLIAPEETQLFGTVEVTLP